MGWQYDQCQGVMLAPKPLPRNLYIAREYTHVWKFARSRVCRKTRVECVRVRVYARGLSTLEKERRDEMRERERAGWKNETREAYKRTCVDRIFWTLADSGHYPSHTACFPRVVREFAGRLLTTTTTISNPLICTRIRRIVPGNNISRWYFACKSLAPLWQLLSFGWKWNRLVVAESTSN